MKLSRVDRIQRTWAVDALFPQLAPGSVTSVAFALLPQRSESPVTGTVWTSPISVVSGNVTVLLAGPEADSTGALVVTETADLWAMATNAPETEAVKIPDRITVAGSSGTLPALPSLYVASVNGKTGSAVLTFSDVGAASTTDTRLSDARAATDASVAALVNNGASSTTVALRAAYGALPKVAATVTVDGAAVLNQHNPVDATSGARTITLPTGQSEGTQISVEKIDTSTNAVALTGSVRGTPGSTISLVWQYETLLLRADSTGSWWPISGHKTKTALDAAYGGASLTTDVFRTGREYDGPALPNNSPLVQKVVKDDTFPSATNLPLAYKEWSHNGSQGYILHLTQGTSMAANGPALIGLGGDNAGVCLFVNNKKTGQGIKITQNDTITSAGAYGLMINNSSSVAPGFWFGSGITNAKPGQTVQNVLGSPGARLWEWRTSTYRTDVATVTSGSGTVTDAAILAGDNGKIVTGTGIPANTYVGTVTAGVSFLLSSSSSSQVNVTATASGTSVNVAQGNGDLLAGYMAADTGNLVWQTQLSVQPASAAGTPLLIQGLAGQTADLSQWNVSGTGLVAKVEKDGTVTSTVRLRVQGAGGSVDLYDTSGTANARRFQFKQTSGFLAFSARDDNNAAGGAGDLLLLGHATGNMGVGGFSSFGSGTKVVGIPNATAIPSANPTGGGVLYAEGGALKWRGSSGTVTVVAPA